MDNKEENKNINDKENKITSNKEATKKEEFDLVDFDLNEYDEEIEKEERLKLKVEAAKQATKDKIKEKQEEATTKGKTDATKNKNLINEPNRDMLKTIIAILGVIFVACLLLGFIALLANSISGSGKKDHDSTQATTTEDATRFDNYNPVGTPEENSNNTNIQDQKKNLEENISNITNKVNENSTTQATTAETTAATAPITEAPTTEVATTEAPTTQAPTTEAPTTEEVIPATESTQETPAEIPIDAQPEQ